MSRPSRVRFHEIVATGLGFGYSPIIPGTVGSLWGVVLYYAAGGAPLAMGVMILLLLGLGLWTSSKLVKETGEKDPRRVVIDEVVGTLIALMWVPAGVGYVALAFVLSRVFDIVKPFPAGRLEQLPSGLGIMADDVAAGVYANIAFQLVHRVFGWV